MKNRNVILFGMLLFIAVVVIAINFLFLVKPKEKVKPKAKPEVITKTVIRNIKFGEFSCKTPDFASINEKTLFKIKNYRSLNDTLNLELNKDRFVCLLVSKEFKKKLNFEDFLKSNLDTIFMFNDRNMSIYLSFNDSGKKYVNAYIEDRLYIDSKEEFKILRKYTDVGFEIVVK